MKQPTEIKIAAAAHGIASEGRASGTKGGWPMSGIVAILFVSFVLSGCGALDMKSGKQDASLTDYLYPGQSASDTTQQTALTELNLPLRCGIAFVPGYADPKFGVGVTEVDRLRWSTQIKSAFEKHPFVGNVVVIPTSYLKGGGGSKTCAGSRGFSMWK